MDFNYQNFLSSFPYYVSLNSPMVNPNLYYTFYGYQCQLTPNLFTNSLTEKLQYNTPVTDPVILSFANDLQQHHTNMKEILIRNISKNQKKQKISKEQKPVCAQNPYRNLYTNIGNQIITFLYQRKKSYMILKRFYKNLTIQEQNNYYQYAKKVKKSVNGYINHTKLRSIWFRNDLKEDQILSHQILRKLSFYYLQSMVVSAVLTSKKMSKFTHEQHFIVRRILLATLADMDD